jgi:hypothetical protein
MRNYVRTKNKVETLKRKKTKTMEKMSCWSLLVEEGDKNRHQFYRCPLPS